MLSKTVKPPPKVEPKKEDTYNFKKLAVTAFQKMVDKQTKEEGKNESQNKKQRGRSG